MTTLLWDSTPGSVERYQLAVGSTMARAETAAAAGRALQDDRTVTEVVIGPGVDFTAACELAEWLRVDRPEVGVLLVRNRLDVSVLSQALRSGVREVVAADDLTALSEAVGRSRELTARMAGSAGHGSGQAAGKVVTVFSAKGGVGKTTVSTNLGAHLADTGSSVLVVDLDLAFGDVAISLQILPDRSITDLLAMAGHLDEQGLASAVSRHSSGLHVLAAPPEPSEAERVPASVVAEVLKVARRMYDVVIVDSPPSFTEHVLTACDTSDLIVLIATLDIPAVKNLRLTLETLDLLGSPKDSRVIVLNRSDAKVGLRAEDVVSAVKQDIAVMVPNSLDVPASVNRGVPLVLDQPRHPVSAAVREIAEAHVRGGLVAAGAEEPVRQRRLLWSRR